jgi:hypothetical protein
MPTLAQKAPQTKSAASATPHRAHPERIPALSAAHRLQRTIGNQALLRMLQAHARNTKEDAAVKAPTLDQHPSKKPSAPVLQQPATLDGRLSEFVAALKKDPAYGNKVQINSTIRDPRRDADAVLNNQRNDPQYYKEFSRNWQTAIVNAVGDRDLKITAYYQAAVDDLTAWILQDPERSAHGVGKAVDFDLAGGDAGFKSFVKTEAERRGLLFKDESKHNHYHVQIRRNGALTAGSTPKKDPTTKEIEAGPSKPKAAAGSKKAAASRPSAEVEQLHKTVAKNLLTRYATFIPFTSTYVGLDKSALAIVLTNIAKSNGGIVLSVLESLDRGDTSEVAAMMVRGKTVKELAALDPSVLTRLRDILGREKFAPTPDLFSMFLTKLSAFEKMLQGNATQSWGMIIYGEGDGKDNAATKASKDARTWSSFDYGEFAKLMELVFLAIPEHSDYRKTLQSFQEEHHLTAENLAKFVKESLEKIEKIKGEMGIKEATKRSAFAASKAAPIKAPNISFKKAAQQGTSKYLPHATTTRQKVELGQWVTSDASGNTFSMIKYSDGTKRFIMGSIFGIKDIEDPGLTEWTRVK